MSLCGHRRNAAVTIGVHRGIYLFKLMAVLRDRECRSLYRVSGCISLLHSATEESVLLY